MAMPEIHVPCAASYTRALVRSSSASLPSGSLTGVGTLTALRARTGGGDADAIDGGPFLEEMVQTNDVAAPSTVPTLTVNGGAQVSPAQIP
jgi:hypothetical protein